MAKVTITIDESNSYIVSLFGENGIEQISDGMGYMTKVEDPNFVPENESDVVPMIDNPKSRQVYVGEETLKRYIAPNFVSGVRKKLEAESRQKIDEAVHQAETAIIKAAEIKVE